MRKLKTILLLSLLTTLLSSPATARATPLSTQGDDAQAVRATDGDSTEAVIARLAAEVTAARTLIASQKEQISALDSQLATERANGESLTKSYAAAQGEIASLRTANDALTRAVALNEQTITLLTKAKDEADRRAKKANKRAIVATLAGAAAVLLKFGVL